MFGKGRKLELRIYYTYDRAHVRKKGISLEVVVQPFETQARSGLFGGESK
jgi:hypothetical protein